MADWYTRTNPYASPTLLNNTMIGSQRGLKSMLLGGVNLANIAINNKQQQEQKDYEDYLKNKLLDGGYKTVGSGVNQTIDPLHLQNGKNINDINSEYNKYIDPQIQSKLFDQYKNQRLQNLNIEDKLLQTQNKDLMNQQRNIVNSYINSIGDVNKDGYVDVNDLNQTGRQGILQTGSIMPELQSSLLSSAQKNKQSNLLYTKQLNDKENIWKEHFNMQQQAQRQNELTRYRHQMDIYKAKQLAKQNQEYRGYLDNINVLAKNNPDLAKKVLSTYDLSNPEEAKQAFNDIKLNISNAKNNEPKLTSSQKVKVTSLLSEYDALKKYYNQTGDKSALLKLKNIGDKLIGYGVPVNNSGYDAGVLNYVNSVSKDIRNIAENRNDGVYDKNNNYFPNSVVLEDKRKNIENAIATKTISKQQGSMLLKEIDNAEKLNDSLKKKSSDQNILDLPNMIYNWNKEQYLTDKSMAWNTLAQAIDKMVSNKSAWDADGFSFLRTPEDYNNYWTPNKLNMFAQYMKDELGLNHLPNKNEIEDFIYEQIKTTNGNKILKAPLSVVGSLGKFIEKGLGANVTSLSTEDYGHIKKGTALHRILDRIKMQSEPR